MIKEIMYVGVIQMVLGNNVINFWVKDDCPLQGDI